nr:hypothetical protein [Mycolicibacterium sp. CR10]
MAVTSRDRDHAAEQEAPPVPWHNRTSTLLGASVAAVAAIAIVVASIGYVARQFSEPTQAPINYVEPAFSSSTGSGSATPTTTGTITSTSPPLTTDINPGLTPTSPSDSSSTTSRNPNFRPPRTREPESDDGSTTRTTRNRPRTNVTRTLNPVP